MKKTLVIAAALLGLSGVGAAMQGAQVNAATTGVVNPTKTQPWTTAGEGVVNPSKVLPWQADVTSIKAVGRVDYAKGYGIAVWGSPNVIVNEGKTLKTGTTWRLFEKAMINGIAWYNLGGGQWVDGTYLDIFVNKTVTVDAKPVKVMSGSSYSSKGTGKVLQPGTKWRVVAERVNGVRFYNLGGNQWALASQFK